MKQLVMKIILEELRGAAVGAKIENLAKKKSDYNFYDSYSPYGHNHLAVPKSETNSPHKDDTKASPTNDELNKRDMKDSTYFKD